MQAVFEEVWSLVHRFYYDADFNGVDWQTVKETYAPRVEATTDAGDFYRLMWDMVEELRDDHTHFRPPDRVSFNTLFNGEFDGLYGGAQYAPLSDGGVHVWRVLPGSWEDEARLKRGDVVVALNGDGDDLAYRLRDGFAPSPGETVTYTLASPEGSNRLLPITYHHLRLRWQVSARRLPGSDIGVVDIPSFSGDDTGDTIRRAITALREDGPLDGLILDLRSNNGGSNAAANRTIQLFLSRNAKEYRCYQYRESPPNTCPDPGEVQRPQAPWSDLPLVVLVNGFSESNGEMVPAILQHFGRASIVGEPTQGNTELVWLYSIAVDFSNLQLAVALSLLPDGRSIEGVGLTPDIITAIDRWDLAQSRDPGLDAAIILLQQESP